MIRSRLRNLFAYKVMMKTAARSARSTTRKPGPLRLAIESLEGRAVPAFLAPVSYSVGTNLGGIAVGDFNADGRDDMAVANNGAAGAVNVLLGNADGSFSTPITVPDGPNLTDATAADMNGDGKLDLVTVGSTVNVLLGHGDGTFGAPTTAPTVVLGSLASVKAGDFNNDGKADVGVMGPGMAEVLLGKGDGTLATAMTTPVSGDNINLVVGDFDRDGNLDMATSNTVSVGTISVLKGRGDGSFAPAVSYDAFSAPVYLAEGDFNHDGYEDFVVPNSYVQTSVSVIMNNGDGTYAPPHTYGIGETGGEVEVGDFNDDGNDDFAVRGAGEYMVHLGKGDGTFYAEQTFPVPDGKFESGAEGDFNGDGATDLAFPTFSGVTVVSNDNASAQDLAGAVTFRVTAPATTTSGSAMPMTVTAVDANGNVATGFRGVAYISSSDPAASTAAGYAFNPLDAGIPYVFTAADAGSHTFTGAIRLVTGGNQTVTVSAPNMTPASTTVDVTNQVTRLDVAAPASAIAGTTINVTITAVDPLGQAATGYSSTVHFFSSDALAGLPADYTFTPDDAGTHTFTVTLRTAGPVAVVATEVGGTVAGGASVDVTPGAAASLALAGGGGAIGFARSFTVVAKDQFGNATSDSGTLHFTSSDPSAVLPPDTALVNGVSRLGERHLHDRRHPDAHRDRGGQPGDHRDCLQQRDPADPHAVLGHRLPEYGRRRGAGVHGHRPRLDRPGRHRVHRHGLLQQQRRAGRPAGQLHLHRGRRRGAHLQRRAEDGRRPVDRRPRPDGRPGRQPGGGHGHPGRLLGLPGHHVDLQPRGDAGLGRCDDPDHRPRGGRLRQRGHQLHRQGDLQQHRRQGDPAGLLHLHRGRCRHPHLQRRPAHGDPARRVLVGQRGGRLQPRQPVDRPELRGGQRRRDEGRPQPAVGRHRRDPLLAQAGGHGRLGQ